MKKLSKTKYIITNLLILLLSLVYVILIRKGLQNQNIDLEKTDKITSIVEKFGLDVRYGSKGRKSKVFYIKLENLDKKVGVYRMSKNYEDLLNMLKIGDEITVNYYENSNERENVNIDLIQIAKGNKILLEKSEYEKKESSLIYIGIGALISHIIIMYHFRKKYLQSVGNKKR